MRTIVSYGWFGNSNIGDEAIADAAESLFDTFNVVSTGDLRSVQTEHEVDSETPVVVAGGTLFPVIADELERWPGPVYSIGAGVKDTCYYSELSRSPLDIGTRIQSLGYNPYQLFRNFTIFGKAIQHLDYRLGSPLGLHNTNFVPEDFRRLGTLGELPFGVRSSYGKRIFEENGIQTIVTGDTSLALSPPKEVSREKIAINVRGTGKLGKVSTGTEYLTEIASFCRAHPEYEVVILPFHPEDDAPCEWLAESIPHSTIETYHSPVDVKSVMRELAQCEFVIGERLHSIVLSVRCLTPFIGIEYRPKVRHFAQSVGMESRIHSPSSLSEVDIRNAFNQRGEYIDEMEANTEMYCDRLNTTADWISAHIHGTEVEPTPGFSTQVY